MPSEKFLDGAGFEHVAFNIDKKLNQYVSSDRTINSKPLDTDIELTASDIGAATVDYLDDKIRANIREKWRSGWPAVWSEPYADTGRVGLMQVVSEESI